MQRCATHHHRHQETHDMNLRRYRRAGLFGALAPVLLFTACAQTPMGPTVQVLPGQGVSFDQFQYDSAQCKGFAEQAVAGQAQNANTRAVGGAVLTTALGAALGAGIGAAAGSAGTGAAIGAGAGALGGAGLGAAGSSNAQLSIQDQYNNAYSQCMYSKGNMVPGYGTMMQAAPPPPSPSGYSNMVHATQVQLIRLGYLHAPADGMMGPMTSNAISQYEQASGLPVNGAPSAALLSRLQATP
jgi:hypothetical protein